ncbi:MAG: ABC-type Fe3+-hydroxamate transport system substrate-binding protein [Bacteroidia bacterium]|jgi:ABC-type Fe3+-hydroxamate transport system substrate-binding protein
MSLQSTDQLGCIHYFDEVPQRIVSLVPSQTEFLYSIGIEPIAQTIFCINPSSSFKTSTKIGGTKKLNIPKILALKPDLIIGNKEENEKAQIDELFRHCPVWMSDVNTIDDALLMMASLGDLLDKPTETGRMVRDIRNQFNLLKSNATPKKHVLYLIWNEPTMGVGSNTFIHSMIEAAGFENALAQQARYPELTNDQIKALNPDLIFLSTEPFPFNNEHVTWFEDNFPRTRVQIVDGEMFSWYGSRMLMAVGYFEGIVSSTKY